MISSFHRRNRQSIRLKNRDYAQPGAYFVTICTQYRQRLFGDVVGGEMVLNDVGRMVQSVWDEIPLYYKGIGIDAFVVMPDHIHGIVIVLPPVPPVGAIPPWLPTFKKTWLPVLNKTELPVLNKQHLSPSKKSVLPPPKMDFYGNITDDDVLWNVGDDGEIAGDHVLLNVGNDVLSNAGNDVLSNAGNHRGIAPTGISSLSDVVRCFKTLTTKRYIDAVHHQNWPPFPGKLWHRNYYENIIRNDISLTRIRQYIANNPKRWLRPP